MLTLTQSKDYNAIKTVITNPVLFRLTYGQGIKVEDFKIDKSWTYLSISDENGQVGLLQVKPLNAIVLEVHIYVLPRHWGKGMAQAIADLGHKWVKSKGYLKTFTKVPANCVHVLKFIQDLNYKCCGQIENGVIHNNILCSMFLYTFEV